MNLITAILAVAIGFGLTDFLTERYPRLQRDIYYIAWFVISFLFAIKYYYGPDIASYVPFYKEVPSIAYILAHPKGLDYHFEPGFAIFCRVLNRCGLSFYWMTVVLSCAYFLVIHQFWKQIDSKRSFALAILVVLDFNVICYELRQCLAVVFFLVMILCLNSRRYIWALICAAAAVMCHISGIVAVLPTLAYYVIRRYSSVQTLSQLLFALLIIMCLVPITRLSLDFIYHLPLSDKVIDSITHHLSLGRQVQVVFFVYAIALISLVHYSRLCQSRIDSIATAAIIGLLCIVIFYQYYYLLNRIRSYFTPLIIVFIFRVVQNVERRPIKIPYGKLAKQLACVILMVYMIHATIALERGGRVLKNKVNETCTVFDLIDAPSAEALQRRQMKRAKGFWTEDYMQHENNKLKR